MPAKPGKPVRLNLRRCAAKTVQEKATTEFIKEVCSVQFHAPYVCNACPTIDKCTLLKTFFDAEKAHLKSHEVISESRSGLSTSEEEIKRLNQIISLLVKQGHSIHLTIGT